MSTHISENKKLNIHYTTIMVRGNESVPDDEWSNSACGREYFENYSDNIKEVTCKKCISKINDQK